MNLKAHVRGTHRARRPADTLATIQPHLRRLGVTRCADITHLDYIGIPTFCAICPENSILQVTNGKGLTPTEAKVSALMEAIELFHAEHPPERLHRCSEHQMEAQGMTFVRAEHLPEFNPRASHSADRVIDWVRGRNLVSNSEIWLPAAAAYCFPLTLFAYTTTGLASGNNTVEAALHALYEVIERHALSTLCQQDDINFSPCDRINPLTVTDETVTSLLDHIANAGLDLVLLKVPTLPSMHCFMGVIIDRDSAGYAVHLSFGYGVHLDLAVAATRAITEAAQTRLTYIHGARNDIKRNLYLGHRRQQEVADFFASFPADADWRTYRTYATDDLDSDLHAVIGGLVAAGYSDVYAVDVTLPDLPVAVVRTFIVGMRTTFPV
jgi:ribosomal protein S12 methylthiotransferase accessory factor